jgi:serine/threonine protein kinase
MIGRRIGNWTIEQELGQGGMGSVYRASHASLPILAACWSKVWPSSWPSEETAMTRARRRPLVGAALLGFSAGVARLAHDARSHGKIRDVAE